MRRPCAPTLAAIVADGAARYRCPVLPALPIDEVLADIPRALKDARACVVQAPPGAGKTTRVPLALRDAGFARHGRILLLEPRRVAARAAAHALARNLGEKPGRTVGYTVRFEEVASRDSEILVVTEGILTRRLISDPTIDDIACVVLDEIHERSIHTDLALAFLRELCEVRDDLKVVAMSATLDAAAVSAFLFDAPIITSAGRPFPVRLDHIDAGDRADHRGEKRIDELVSAAIRKLVIAKDDDGGDVLAFLPGTPEIRRVQERLAERALPGDIEVLPLYGALPPAEQDRAIQKGDRRRVILATNVAETSLTLPGVSAVVDSGLMKSARYDPATDREHLDTVRISLASAEQRAGRAGRLRPGRCVRLWTASEHAQLQPSFAPEIMRADLAPVVMDVLAFHPGDVRQFAFFERPPAASLDRALSLLHALGATQDGGKRLSARGKKLADLPLHPRTATLLLAAGPDVSEVALEAAILDDDRVHPRDEARTTTDSDVALVAERLDRRGAGREVLKAYDDLARYARHVDPEGSRTHAYLSAYLDRLCKRRRAGEPEARMVGGRGVKLGRESGVKDSELFLALALDGRDKSAARVTLAESVTLEQIRAHRPELVKTVDEAVIDEARGALAGVRRTYVLDLVVEEKTGIALPPGAAGQAVAKLLASDLSQLRFNDDVRTLLARLQLARTHLSHEDWPDTSDDGIRALLPDACADVRSVEEARRLPWLSILKDRVPYKVMKLLDDELPEKLAVPSGSHITVDYLPAITDGGLPVLAVRLQELFGLAETPTLARGRLPVLLHLLSPGYKPVQVTRDLKSFWSSTYADVKKELKARYPKHHWPDDPWTATPTARAKRRGT
jgi:ATP-dependent helicase HrpB